MSTPIVYAFQNVPSGNGAVLLKIPKNIHAVCGTAAYDTMDAGPVSSIFDQRPVKCAQRLIDGSIEPGTSLRLVNNGCQPAFIEDKAQSIKLDTFSVQTQADFTLAGARQNGYFVGTCGPFQSASLFRSFGFYSIFTPKPNTTHYIQPRPIFGILLGSFQPGSRFIGAVDDILEVNFSTLGSDDVEIVHTERNQLVIVKNPVLYNEVTL